MRSGRTLRRVMRKRFLVTPKSPTFSRGEFAASFQSPIRPAKSMAVRTDDECSLLVKSDLPASRYLFRFTDGNLSRRFINGGLINSMTGRGEFCEFCGSGSGG